MCTCGSRVRSRAVTFSIKHAHHPGMGGTAGQRRHSSLLTVAVRVLTVLVFGELSVVATCGATRMAALPDHIT